MRPKFLSLLAVPALAMVGCSAAEPAKAPKSSPAAVVSESPKPTVKKTENPNERVEQQFVDFAETRADVHGATVNRKPKEIVESLHAYCEDGQSIEISKSKDLNDNMEFIADKQACEKLK